MNVACTQHAERKIKKEEQRVTPMKKGGLYALLAATSLYTSPLAAAEQQSLEGKVTSPTQVKEIDERYIQDSPTSNQRDIANYVKKIKQLLEERQVKKIDFSKEYAPHSTEESLRFQLILESRALTKHTIHTLNFGYSDWDEYRAEFTEPILRALKAVEDAFGTHITSYPQRGRQKVLVQLLAGKKPILGKDIEPIYHTVLADTARVVRNRTDGTGYHIPERYHLLLNQTIESWEHWSNNYTHLDEARRRPDCVPPEYREEHQKRAVH